MLKALPSTREHLQQELELQLTLGIPLSATRGYAAPEVAHIYTRAQELCQQMGETPQLIPVLLGLWRFYLLRAELVKARELAERCLLLVQRLDDPACLIVAHDVLGETLFFLGDFAQARTHLEQAVAPRKRTRIRSVAWDAQLRYYANLHRINSGGHVGSDLSHGKRGDRLLTGWLFLVSIKDMQCGNC